MSPAPTRLARSLALASLACSLASCGPKPPPPEAPPGSVPVQPEASKPKGGPVFLMPEKEEPGPVQGPPRPVGPPAAASDAKHPATIDECRQITDHALDLTLRANGITDPDAADQARAAFRSQLGGKMSTDCQGQPISDAQLRCALAAATTAALEQCVR